MTGSPKRVRTATTRSGVSSPWSCSIPGFSAAILAASSSSPASTESATLIASPRTRAPSARAASTSTWRGEAAKKTKPTMSAPASSAASSASGVVRPQILITTGMDAGLLQARFYIGADDLSRLSSPLMSKESSGSRRDAEPRRLIGRRWRGHGHGRELGRCEPPPQGINLGAQLARLRIGKPRRTAPFALPRPCRDTPDRDADDQKQQHELVERQRPRHGGMELIERVEGDEHGLTVRHRQRHDDDGERNQDQRGDDLAEHDLMRSDG